MHAGCSSCHANAVFKQDKRPSDHRQNLHIALNLRANVFIRLMSYFQGGGHDARPPLDAASILHMQQRLQTAR